MADRHSFFGRLPAPDIEDTVKVLGFAFLVGFRVFWFCADWWSLEVGSTLLNKLGAGASNRGLGLEVQGIPEFWGLVRYVSS